MSNDNWKATFKPEKEYTDVFFEGKGGVPDGPGHGHIRVDTEGNEQIVRDSFEPGQPNARRDATLLDDKTPDRRP